MVEILVDSVWLGPLLWFALYTSDNVLTIVCARMYQAQDKIAFEGSYEITPLFQADVNALRRWSPRFVVALLASTGYVVLVQQIAHSLYLAVLGGLLLVQVTVHTRHLRNWFQFKYGIPSIQGRLTYARSFMLRMSAFELLTFAALYLILFLTTGSPFILGGALGTGVLSLNNYRLARRHDAAVAAAARQGMLPQRS